MNVRRIGAIIAGGVFSLFVLFVATWLASQLASTGDPSIRISAEYERLVRENALLTWASYGSVIAACVLAGYVAGRLDPGRAAWVGAAATAPYIVGAIRYLTRPPMPYYSWQWFLLILLIPVIGYFGAHVAHRPTPHFGRR